MRKISFKNDYVEFLNIVDNETMESIAFPISELYFRFTNGNNFSFYLKSNDQPFKKVVWFDTLPLIIDDETYLDYESAAEALSVAFGDPNKELKEKVEEIENNLNTALTNIEDNTERIEDLSEEVVTLNEGLQTKADKDSVYTQNEVDLRLNLKVDNSTLENQYYNKDVTDEKLDAKADADNVYSKTETDELLDAKADADNVYSKSETDEKLDEKANLAEIDMINENIEQILDDLDTKQDILIDQENIKSIQNQSILGSGNIDLFELLTQEEYDALVEKDYNKLYLIDDNHRIYFKGRLIIDNSTPTPPTPPTPTGELCMTLYSDADTFEIYRNEGETLKQALARYIAENVGEEGTGVVRVWQKSINRVVFDDSITQMNESPFDQMNGMYNNITEMTLPSNLETIGAYGFEHVSVTNWTIPSTVTSIGRYAFVGCYDGENPIRRTFNFLSSTPPSMNDYTIFSQDINCDEENGKIDDYEYVTIKVPNCEAVNAYKEFFNSKGTQWQRLANRVFTDDECDKGRLALTLYTSSPDDPEGDSYEVYKKADETVKQALDRFLEERFGSGDDFDQESANIFKANITHIVFDDSVTEIEDAQASLFGYAFNEGYELYDGYWENITSVTLPNNLQTIGHAVLADMPKVQNWNIPQSVGSIGGAAFHRMSDHPNVERTIRFNSLECPSLGYYTFDMNDGMEWMADEHQIFSVPSDLIEEAGESVCFNYYVNAFNEYGGADQGYYGTYVENGQIHPDECVGEHLALTLCTDENEDGRTFEVYQKANETVKQALDRFLTDRFGSGEDYDEESANTFKDSITHVIFDDSVTEISGTYLFSYSIVQNLYDADWKNITSVTLPSNLQTIGHNAFGDMPKVSYWNIPGTIQRVGSLAFERVDTNPNVFREIRFNTSNPPIFETFNIWSAFDLQSGSSIVADTNQKISCERGEECEEEFTNYFNQLGGNYAEYVNNGVLQPDECM